MTVFTLCSSGMVLMEWMAAQTQCSPKVDGRSALIRTWPSNPSWTSHSLKMTWVSLVLSCFVVLPQCTVWYVVWIYTIFWLWMMKGLVWCLTAPHPPPGHPANIKWCTGISSCLSCSFMSGMYLLNCSTPCHKTGCPDAVWSLNVVHLPTNRRDESLRWFAHNSPLANQSLETWE